MKKFAIITNYFGLFGWERHVKFADNKQEAEKIEKTYRECFNNEKLQVVETITYTEYLRKYRNQENGGKSITINIYDKDNGELLYCFNGSNEPVSKGEVITFNYKLKKLNIEIQDAEFVITNCSKEYNNKQNAFATFVPNSGKIIFPMMLKKDIDRSLRMFIDVIQRLKLMNKTDEINKLKEANKILRQYVNY